MKLVLKQKQLNEEKEGDKYYLYHATVTKPDLSFLHSFRKGIRSNVSLGMAAKQGSGFYLFSTHEEAYERLFSPMLVQVEGSYQPFDKQRDGFRMIVTIEAGELDPTKFDLDSEISSKFLVEKFIENMQEFNKSLPPEYKIKLAYNRTNAIRLRTHLNSITTISTIMEPDSYSAETLAKYCEMLDKNAPEVWRKVEREMLEGANAIKYIGKDLIIPHEIEVLDDSKKIHDATKSDPPFLKKQ